MKADLRNHLLQKRNRLTRAEIKVISQQITDKVIRLPEFQDAKTIHCYLSIDNEISTNQITGKLSELGKKLVVPRIIAGTNRLEHVVIDSRDQLIPNAWGISEPSYGSQVQPELLDLVIVPMVGGDPHCNRLGYGKGFYDQFLSLTTCAKIGLTAECCLVDKIPVEPHDVKLDLIVTENRIIYGQSDRG